MTNPEYPVESFVVRIWLERREIAGAPAAWRGMIEHVASGKRRYFLDLDGIVVFLAEYLSIWDVRPCSWMLLRERFRRLGTSSWYSWFRRSRGIT